jgi:hypothetical protein
VTSTGFRLFCVDGILDLIWSKNNGEAFVWLEKLFKSAASIKLMLQLMAGSTDHMHLAWKFRAIPLSPLRSTDKLETWDKHNYLVDGDAKASSVWHSESAIMFILGINFLYRYTYHSTTQQSYEDEERQGKKKFPSALSEAWCRKARLKLKTTSQLKPEAIWNKILC